MVSIPTGRDQTLQDDLLSCLAREINSVRDRRFTVDLNVAGPAVPPSIHETRSSEQHRANEG